MNRIDSAPEKSALLLQACLDMITHPAWITENGGQLMLNQHARDLEQQGVSIRSVTSASKTVTVQGKRFRMNRRDMHNGTDCVLVEMHQEDEPIRRLQESTRQLAAALEGRC